MPLFLHIPPNSPEIAFSVKILLSDILGLEFSTKTIEHCSNPELILPNRSIITFEDGFFENTEGKYTKENLPTGLVNFEYSNKTYKVLSWSTKYPPHPAGPPRRGILKDILASTFFFASRWEETLIKPKDKHKRISAKETFLYKHNLLDIPWVEEYALLLKDMMQDLCPEIKFPKQKLKVHLTHDIDNPYLFYNFKTTIKYFGILLLRDFNIKEIFFGIKTLFSKKDPYSTMDYLMEASDSLGLKSTFYLLAGEKGEPDFRYSLNDKKVQRILSNISNKEHNIGIHPGLNTFDNGEQIRKEVKRINKTLPKPVTESRQHFLKFDIDKTPQLLEQNNIKTDSTLCYHDYIGFRSGICREHSLFDLENRKTLKLRERPLSIMDTSLRKYLNLSEKEAFNAVKKSIEVIKKYNGEFVLLWHNSSFNTHYWKKYINLYPRIIQLIKQNLR